MSDGKCAIRKCGTRWHVDIPATLLVSRYEHGHYELRTFQAAIATLDFYVGRYRARFPALVQR